MNRSFSIGARRENMNRRGCAHPGDFITPPGGAAAAQERAFPLPAWNRFDFAGPPCLSGPCRDPHSSRSTVEEAMEEKIRAVMGTGRSQWAGQCPPESKKESAAQHARGSGESMMRICTRSCRAEPFYDHPLGERGSGRLERGLIDSWCEQSDEPDWTGLDSVMGIPESDSEDPLSRLNAAGLRYPPAGRPRENIKGLGNRVHGGQQ
ncbi:hypothetical protein B2J93_3857 [Marssonina coronariae]|uniref:Uncharacterized protein n=1 Tax=Diplocarpon coronariae TaxID=2795749 RepID=A0A218ZFJ3_9HELO|nr:hypothetical protein B2J93_3857 [Marssonina coronariae]